MRCPVPVPLKCLRDYFFFHIPLFLKPYMHTLYCSKILQGIGIPYFLSYNNLTFQTVCDPVLDTNTRDPNNKRRLRGKKRDKSFPPKNKREKKQKKRRYMKSSCQWTTIRFHFEVLRAVVKCDCMWQLPSRPVYHDGYTHATVVIL